jgi:hypothetical protein
MPGLVRKLLIFASLNGVVVQAHSSVEHHRPIQIDYRSNRISNFSLDHNEAVKEKKEEQLEAHGLIGITTLASWQACIS